MHANRIGFRVSNMSHKTSTPSRKRTQCITLLVLLTLLALDWGLALAQAPAATGNTSESAPHVVFLISEDEYDTRTTLPAFAEAMLAPLGLRFTILHSTAEDTNRFPEPAFNAVTNADLLFLSLRRRALPPEQLDRIRTHIAAGKPVIGIRTASHGFAPVKAPSPAHTWPRFDQEILGADYQGHYGKGAAVVIRPIAETAGHPILRGIANDFRALSHLYKYRNVFRTVSPLLNGVAEDGSTGTEPVAWVNSADNRKVFYTSLGAVSDFQEPNFRRLLRNATLWALNLPVPNDPMLPRTTQMPQPTTRGLNGLSARDAEKTFTTPDDLEFKLLLAEPDIAQPIHISFDERGRLWVVEYRQYPNPAGLKMISRDNFWRAVYDKVPQPPPNHVRGADRISIHEDTDGDGRYDKHTVFVDGLNIATSACKGRGGVWVLNPPYLLFYPDRNNDDVPDGDPVVHLAGFGLEDTHSVVNSLRWGPDGWLYAAQGSTVTANIQRPGLDTAPILRSTGQQIWRYHPETRRFEVFSEGGGNAFGCEIDDSGRIFSGHNGGNTRGFHYMQGAYLQKGFEKHGPLSNPYAFGYFPPMAHHDAERFTHNFVLYSGTELPARYHGKLLGVEPMQGRVVMSDIEASGSTFKTHDVGHPVTSTDTWFRPVEIKQGPDGAVYVCDFYERQVNLYRNHEGQVDPDTGRIYRLQRKGATSLPRFDLTKWSSSDLVRGLSHSNKWFRQTMIRLLIDRRDPNTIPLLESQLIASRGQLALESLWGLHASGGLTPSRATTLLSHAEPTVRAWTARLICDAASPLTTPVIQAYQRASRVETNLETRAQLACSAKRLPASQGLPILRALLDHDSDVSDARQPLLLWWALESWITQDRAAVLSLFEESPLWSRPIVLTHLLPRLSRRLAQEGGSSNLLACAQLFEIAPDVATSQKLLEGFEAAFEGRPMEGLPDRLLTAMSRHLGGSTALGLKQGKPEAIAAALKTIQDGTAKESTRLQYLAVLSERKTPEALSPLIKLVRESSPKQRALRLGAIAALQLLEDPSVASQLLPLHTKLDSDSRIALQHLMLTRTTWTTQFLSAVESHQLATTEVDSGVLRRLRQAHDPQLLTRVERLWGKRMPSSSAESVSRAADLASLIRQGGGEPYSGRSLFQSRCGSCHRLFGWGNDVGPDLTSYRRNDLENLVMQILQPSVEIREGYENYELETKDDRSLNGFLIEQDGQRVVLRGVDGRKLSVERSEILSMRVAMLSLMPEGLLEGLATSEIRDLFAYLQSTQPLVGERPGR